MRWSRQGLGVLATVALGCASACAGQALAAGRVVWSDYGDGSVAGADLTAGTVVPLHAASVGSHPSGTAIDLVANRVYWIDSSANKIYFAPLDGSGDTAVLNTGTAPIDDGFGLAIDPITGTIYWANGLGGSAIGYAKVNGSGGGILNITGASASLPSGVAVDLADGRLYWTNYGNSTISYANLDNSGAGHNITTLGATASSPEGIAINPATGKMYWANFGGSGSIGSAGLDGTGAALLPTTGVTPDGPAGVALDAAANRIYWGDTDSGRISYANLDGTGGGGTVPIPAGNLSDPSFPVVVRAPTGVAAPVLTGGTTAGSTLTCSIGTWAEDIAPSLTWQAPRSFTYAWTLNGSALADETGAKLTRTAAGVYTCSATATNFGGSATQTSASHTLTATLTINAIGTGTGSVSGGGIACPGTCTARIAGTSVTLTARAAAGSAFTGWAGACAGTGPCTIAVGHDEQIAAVFTRNGLPDTRIVKATIDAKRHQATFVLASSGGAARYQCALHRAPTTKLKFSACTSPKAYKHLKPGKYTFEVRAGGPGGTDPTPASKRFTLR